MTKYSFALANAVVIVLLSAGTAVGASGHDTIFSNDIAEGAVHSSDIKNGTVHGSDVTNGSLTGTDIKDHSLTSKDFKGIVGSVGPKGDKGDTGATGATGATGDTGKTGPEGPQGPAGTSATSGYEYVEGPGTEINGGGFGQTVVDVACPAGKKVVGGGYREGVTQTKTQIVQSKPNADGSGWTVVGLNAAGSLVYVSAICVNAS